MKKEGNEKIKGQGNKRKRIWPLEILAGIFLMAAVCIFSFNEDISRTEEELHEKVNYIKE